MFRHPRWIPYLCFGVALLTSSVQAQAPRLSPKEIGQIINVALDAVPPDSLLPRSTAEKREIRFAYGRTLAAFGSADNADIRASLGLTRAMAEGSDALLEDCNQMGMGKCSKLGKLAIVMVQPTSISNSEVVVWVNVAWATTVDKRSFLSARGGEVILRQSGSGSWTLFKKGGGIVS